MEKLTASGTHLGELFGVPPTARSVAVRGSNVFRLRDSRILERWVGLDEVGVMRQLGLVAQP